MLGIQAEETVGCNWAPHRIPRHEFVALVGIDELIGGFKEIWEIGEIMVAFTVRVSRLENGTGNYVVWGGIRIYHLQ